MARSNRAPRKSYAESQSSQDDEQAPNISKKSKLNKSPPKAARALAQLDGRKHKPKASENDEEWTGSPNKRKGKKPTKPIDKIVRGALSQLLSLPVDVLVAIFSLLEPYDIFHLSLVNRQLHQFLWRRSAMTIYKKIQRNLSFYAPSPCNFASIADPTLHDADRSEPKLKHYTMPDPPPDKAFPAYFRDYFCREICMNCGQKFKPSEGVDYTYRTLCFSNGCFKLHKMYESNLTLEFVNRFGEPFRGEIMDLLIRRNKNSINLDDVNDALNIWEDWIEEGMDQTQLGILIQDRRFLKEDISKSDQEIHAWQSARELYLLHQEKLKQQSKAEARKLFLCRICNLLAEKMDVHPDDASALLKHLQQKKGKNEWFTRHNEHDITDEICQRFRQHHSPILLKIANHREQLLTCGSHSALQAEALSVFNEWLAAEAGDVGNFWPSIADLFLTDPLQGLLSEWMSQHKCRVMIATADFLNSNLYPALFCRCNPTALQHHPEQHEKARFRLRLNESKDDIIAEVKRLHDKFKLEIMALLSGRQSLNTDSNVLDLAQHRFRCACCPAQSKVRLTWPTLFNHCCIYFQCADSAWNEDLQPVDILADYGLIPRCFDTKLITYDMEHFRFMSDIALYLGTDEATSLPKTHLEAQTWQDHHRIACLDCQANASNQIMTMRAAIEHCGRPIKLIDGEGGVVSNRVHKKIKVVDYEAPLHERSGFDPDLMWWEQ